MCLRMEKPISLWFLEGNVTVSAAESLLLSLIAFTMFDFIDKEWKLIYFFFNCKTTQWVTLLNFAVWLFCKDW